MDFQTAILDGKALSPKIVLAFSSPSLTRGSGSCGVHEILTERDDIFDQMSNGLAAVAHFVCNERLGKRERD